MRAGALYFIPIFAGIIFALGLAGIFGQLLGFGWQEAILFIGIPIMGGGTSAGAVPTSQVYGELMSQEAGYYLSLLMPAVALGNGLAIVFAGLLNKIGSTFPNVTGNGVLMKNFQVSEDKGEKKETVPNYQMMGTGFIITGVFFAIGRILSMLVPSIHYYAWTIIAVGTAKIFGIFPKELEPAVTQWYDFLLKISIPAVLMGIGMVYTDLSIVIESFSLQYFILVLVTVMGAVLGSWFAGRLVGFYPLESSLTAGLCMANMGGTEDIATLGAARRMELMHFAQISSRIGGAIMLIIASLLASTFGKMI